MNPDSPETSCIAASPHRWSFPFALATNLGPSIVTDQSLEPVRTRPHAEGFQVLRKLPPYRCRRCLELQSCIERVMPRLHQIPSEKPQPLLLRWLPHVAQLALPRAGVVLRA